RHPAHERAGAIHQPGDSATRIRHRTSTGARLPPSRRPIGGAPVSGHTSGASPTVAAAAVPETPERRSVPAWRLIATLAIAGATAGLLIVTVFQWAQPRIQAHQAEVLRGAVAEVLKAPARTERFFLYQGALTMEVPPVADTLAVERVFLGYDDA